MDGQTEVQTNGLRHWLVRLADPQVLLWAVVIVAGMFAQWITTVTRIAVLEGNMVIQFAAMQRQLDMQDVQHRQELKDAVIDRNRRLESSEQRSEEADTRLWNDIRDLRQRLDAHERDDSARKRG